MKKQRAEYWLEHSTSVSSCVHANDTYCFKRNDSRAPQKWKADPDPLDASIVG